MDWVEEAPTPLGELRIAFLHCHLSRFNCALLSLSILFPYALFAVFPIRIPCNSQKGESKRYRPIGQHVGEPGMICPAPAIHRVDKPLGAKSDTESKLSQLICIHQITLVLALCASLVLAAPSLEIQGSDFVNAKTGKRFQVVGVAYQPAGSSGYNPGSDPLSDGDICLRDAALMQRLGEWSTV